ncbi:MAG TPA: rRNA pseudouridine synthase [Candidatus Magasanikbacteria bacterium]|nr:MAG: hypothetical protein A3I74_02335 [Candidatus Magasanikbacteria bacterium RIFCSPLOWO2_02_FULL_47_16]OGH79653.1 MAG: hypothetical protein A3C10_01065 [Candidatus Magasanikbacteria bacterium RIFCSPHIGHO2_02_FULL_48_18]OGH83133.1 MAG: hypothetical protein A3G08_00130 [Candidatus Magasanikbacteria bacterium RIFCSPLOWO2_12_FULL_47_9b]HAZ28290.1 rRNA pseudouridine synthase [Candidatus Magasanikbacteria bacterium]
MPETMRIHKYMAIQGMCSRRKAEELIRAGKVRLNGRVVTTMGRMIDPLKDTVEIIGDRAYSKSGAPIIPKAPVIEDSKLYIALNKPVGYITSASNTQGQSVIDLMTPDQCMQRNSKKFLFGKDRPPRVFPVGRLDKDSEGLVLLTNDGDLANRVTHPRYEHEKEYDVVIDHPLTRDAKKVLEHGMKLDDDIVGGVDIIKEFNKGRQTIVTVMLTEGKNRQIRKMFGRLGYVVHTLRRTRIGKLKLGVLPVGRWRFVRKEHIV